MAKVKKQKEINIPMKCNVCEECYRKWELPEKCIYGGPFIDYKEIK